SGGIVDALHGAHGGGDDLTALLRRLARGQGKPAGLAGAVGVLLHRARDLLQAGRRLLERGCLLLRSGGELGRGRRELRGGGGRVAGRLANFPDDLVNPVKGDVEPASQPTDLVSARDLESPGQVPLGDLLEKPHHLGQRSGDHPADQERQNREQQTESDDFSERQTTPGCVYRSLDRLGGQPQGDRADDLATRLYLTSS